MARIENWDRIKRNIIVLKYDPYKVDQQLLEQIRKLDSESAKLKLEARRNIEIYIPDRHPILEMDLLKAGRIVELSDVQKFPDCIKERRKLLMVEYIDEVNDLTNILSTNILTRLRYDHEKYRKVSGFVWDDRAILKLSGVQERNLI